MTISLGGGFPFDDVGDSVIFMRFTRFDGARLGARNGLSVRMTERPVCVGDTLIVTGLKPARIRVSDIGF